jgi:seryl-tRNA synthetase
VIDSRLLLDDFENTARLLERKGVELEFLLQTRDAMRRQRDVLRRTEEARAAMNRIANTVGAAARSGSPPATLLEESKVLKARVTEAEAELKDADSAARDLLLRVPNVPSPEAPVGTSEDDNVVLEVHDHDAEYYASRRWRPHWETAEEFGIFDPKRAARLSGSMFALLRGDGARLLRALVDFGLDLNRDTYEEIAPPHMVRSDVFTATGHLPKFEMDAYKARDDDLWLVPTGEVPLTSIHRDEVLEEVDLPKHYMAYTVCWRREAGSAGKETRGMHRLHEFHKVELVRLTTPERVDDEFEGLLADAVRPIRLLELPYRLLDLCTADLTFSSARIIDVEVYAPGSDRWVEVSSVGYFSDFQSRRANIRYRPADGGRPAFVYALNGSALATPRVWLSLIEHGLQEDGQSIRLPAALADYFGGDTIRPNG